MAGRRRININLEEELLRQFRARGFSGLSEVLNLLLQGFLEGCKENPVSFTRKETKEILLRYLKRPAPTQPQAKSVQPPAQKQKEHKPKENVELAKGLLREMGIDPRWAGFD